MLIILCFHYPRSNNCNLFLCHYLKSFFNLFIFSINQVLILIKYKQKLIFRFYSATFRQPMELQNGVVVWQTSVGWQHHRSPTPTTSAGPQSIFKQTSPGFCQSDIVGATARPYLRELQVGALLHCPLFKSLELIFSNLFQSLPYSVL